MRVPLSETVMSGLAASDPAPLPLAEPQPSSAVCDGVCPQASDPLVSAGPAGIWLTLVGEQGHVQRGARFG